MSCQFRLPRAKSPNAFMNSCRAARKGLPSGWAGGALSGRCDARMPREPAGHPPRHANGENRENERPADDFEERARGAEEGARLNQGDPTLRDLRPQTHDQVEEEHFDAHPERVGNEVVGEGRRTPEGREPEEEHPTAEHEVAL